HALGSTGGPQKGLPQTQPTMPPTTRPTGPPSNKPDPAPNTAPTLSARELVGEKARAIRIGAAASKVLRMVHPHKARCEVEHKSLRDSTRQTGRRLFSVDCCGIATSHTTRGR